MIPKQENVKVFSNSTNEKGFSIVASREAFRILSSGLYSNKPQAIIRELSCNAYDSHIMAGCPELPFKIHLPDAWEPFFSIEDFGIGLDDDDINNIYTTYFASTKRTSNDTIGGKGLGSKTPFSYTDTFTIRARKDSVERIYNAYISEAGSPTVSLMSEIDTDERNGVLITVPVRQVDFNHFNREAHNVFKYFGVKPDGWEGDNSIVQELEDNNGMIIRNSNAGSVTVIMGTVAYTVRVTESEIPATYKRAWSFLNKTNLIIRFGIGDLSTTASRETIDFDEETKEIFINRIENIIDEYYSSFQTNVDNCATVFQALKYVESALGEWAWGIMNYKGESLSVWANKNALDEIRSVIDPKSEFVEGELQILTRGSGNQLSTNVLIDKWGTHKITYKGLRHGDRIIFFMDDTDHGRGFQQTARQYIRSRYEKNEILLPFVLDQTQMDAIATILGDVLSEFILLTEAKEQFKIVREKAKAEAGPRKDAVARAKKNEIRLDCWENDSVLFNIDQRRLLDIDELSSKRVGHFVVNRGYSDAAIMGIEQEVCPQVLIYLCKIFALDYIVMTRPSQVDNVREKMPFLIELHQQGLKDVKNNEAAFFYSVLNILNESVLSISEKIDRKNFETGVDNSIFEKFYYHQRYDLIPVKVAKALKNLSIPEMTNEILSHELITKLKDGMDLFNETEISVSKVKVSISVVNEYNPWKKIYDNYVSSIAVVIFARNELICKKYPLIVRLMDEIYYQTDNLCEEVDEYIQMVHERNMNTLVEETIEDFAPVEISEEMEEKELYEEVA